MIIPSTPALEIGKMNSMNSLARPSIFWTVLTLLLSVISGAAWGQSSISVEESTLPVQEQSSTAAGEGPGDGISLAEYSSTPQKKPFTDLTLDNFFSAGWNDDFAMRSRATGTPDLTLLRVQTNYLLRATSEGTCTSKRTLPAQRRET